TAVESGAAALPSLRRAPTAAVRVRGPAPRNPWALRCSMTKIPSVKATSNGQPRHRSKREIEETHERPKALSVKTDNIPTALRELHQWVCWRYVWREDKEGKGRWTKTPVAPANGRLASTTDTATWATFDDALARHKRYRMMEDDTRKIDGVGFVF